ncbi:MAG: TAXI family TRAP transporter solute-binding subunit [Congregibacter sp.]
MLLGVHTEEPAPTVARLLSDLKPDGQSIRVAPFEDVAALTSALADGSLDLALLEGTQGDTSGIALVADLYPSVLHVLYQGDQTPDTVGDLLRDSRVWAGSPGGIGHRLVQAVAADFGLGTDQYELLDDPWSEGEPEVYFIFGGILAPESLSRLQQFRLFSLGDPNALRKGSVAEGVSLRYPQLQPFIVPAQLYPSLGKEAALTLSTSTLLVVRDTLDADIVYELAQGVADSSPRIAATYPLAGLPRMSQEDGAARELSLHEGARRYRDRDLPGFLERYTEALGIAVTLLLATGSLVLGWRRHRQQQRKDRLDGYYKKMLALRKSLVEGRLLGVDMVREIRATQAEVMELVIEERIDADSALQVFLSLSNQLLLEADAS